jgi:hypothetical protein
MLEKKKKEKGKLLSLQYCFDSFILLPLAKFFFQQPCLPFLTFPLIISYGDILSLLSEAVISRDWVLFHRWTQLISFYPWAVSLSSRAPFYPWKSLNAVLFFE